MAFPQGRWRWWRRPHARPADQLIQRGDQGRCRDGPQRLRDRNNAAWLAQYDASTRPSPSRYRGRSSATDTVYQSRRGGAWADVTGLVRGEKGTGGATGPQARFSRLRLGQLRRSADCGADWRHVRAKFDRHVKTVPVGYTGSPRYAGAHRKDLPRASCRSIRRTDPDIRESRVELCRPSLPSTTRPGLRKRLRTEPKPPKRLAEQAAGQAVDIPTGSPRGALVATSPTLPTAATGSNSVIAFGTAELWTIRGRCTGRLRGRPGRLQ